MGVNQEYLSYGGDLMVFVGSGQTKSPIAFSTSAKLSVSMKTRDISSKDSGDWTEKAAGKFDWNASTDALTSFSATGTTHSVEDLYGCMIAKCPINLAFGKRCGTTPSWGLNTSSKYFSGSALITSMDLTASDQETSTYSVTFEGNGILSIT
jgi:predicted secreted protein